MHDKGKAEKVGPETCTPVGLASSLELDDVMLLGGSIVPRYAYVPLPLQRYVILLTDEDALRFGWIGTLAQTAPWELPTARMFTGVREVEGVLR